MAQPGAEPGSNDQPGGFYPSPGGPGSTDNTDDNDSNSVLCICGKPFQELTAKNCYGGGGVQCDGCSKPIPGDSIVYHCPDEKIKIHEGGYDLCSKCATKEKLANQGTEGGPGATSGGDVMLDDDGKPVLVVPKGYVSETNNPPCICGQELMQMAANKAYEQGGGIQCDNCSKMCNGEMAIWHCPDNKSKAHDGGYDLCFDCGWKYVEAKMDEQALATTMGNNDMALDLAPGTIAHTEKVQTEALVPVCICGDELLKTDSRVYGQNSGGVICDNCREQCTGDDIVYHCPRGQKAKEHKDGFDLCEKCGMKQNKRVRTNWLSDLFEDMIVTIARFFVNKRPASVVTLKSVNRHWYQCLNPNKPNVNALWQHNICRPLFPHISNELKIKRWDRYYQYRYHSILRWRKENYDNTKINKKLVYTKYKVIENCSHDLEEINAFYRDPFTFEMDDDDEDDGKKKKKKKKIEVDDHKDDYDGYFDAQFGSHGLPKGYKWKLKCPVLALKLKQRGDSKYYCNVCKKNVFVVNTEEEMAQKVKEGKCIQFTLSGIPSVQKDEAVLRPVPIRQGRVVRRR